MGVRFGDTQNDFKGPVTVNGVSLFAAPDTENDGAFAAGSLGDLKNGIVLNGGSLWWLPAAGRTAHYCVAPSRTIHLGPGGGIFGGSGPPLKIRAKITGPGFFREVGESTCPIVISNSENDYSGGTWINISDTPAWKPW